MPRALVQALAKGLVLVHLALVVSAERVQEASVAAQAELLRPRASHRVPSVPAQPKAVADASNTPRQKKAR